MVYGRGIVRKGFLAVLCSLLWMGAAARAQSLGVAGAVDGIVKDPTGAVIPGATATIHDFVSGYVKTATTDAQGQFSFSNLPASHYHINVTQDGFAPYSFDADINSPLPITQEITLQLANSNTTVEVNGDSNDLLYSNPAAHTDIDRSLIAKLPQDSTNSGLSSAITMASPGIAADSDGMFHPLGEHSDTTFSVDGQPISDQQSRIFSNEISANDIQSLQVIDGVIPPEYGDKASIVAVTTTRSGLGNPHGEGNASLAYGSFGTTTFNSDYARGTQRSGNFTSFDGVNSGRFLDAPEYKVMHAHGNNENFFDRVDYNPRMQDTLHTNLILARSWFQNPNQYDQQAAGQDQRSEIFTYDVSPFWAHLFGSNSLLTVNPYLRQDNVHYYPSGNKFADQPATMQQDRMLRNLGFKVDYAYTKGVNNVKIGTDIYQTFLNEEFQFGITSPAFNPVCLTANGGPVTGDAYTNPNQCAAAGYTANPNFQPGLLQYDLTRNGASFHFQGHTVIKEEALYAEDTINLKSLSLLLGLRGDNYNGLTSRYMLEPRVGGTYSVAKTGTKLRLGYARLMPTPYNENLILSSYTGNGGLANNLGAYGQSPLVPASRNQFNTGIEQGFGRYVVIDAQYFWKFTKRDYDFDVILNTPLTFPIQWRKSKIDGAAVTITMPKNHGLSAYSVLGHARSRFFGPEVGGIIFNDPSLETSTLPFRIDHDQAFQQTTHLQYQPRARGPWAGFDWTYESGLVAGNAPFGVSPTQPVDLTYLTPDQQQQAELSCNGVRATLSAPLTSCLPAQLQSGLLYIPAAGTENNDKNPPRVLPRTIFDATAGWDNLLRARRVQINARLTATNFTNKVAMYNFLSTFSGTHYIPPRMYTAQVSLTF